MLPHESGFEKTSPGEPVGISTGNCVDPFRSSVFYWDEIPCNPLTVILDRRMLLEGGYRRSQFMGVPRYTPKRYVEVIYDRRFVMEKITSTILNPLKCKDLGEVASLINQDISRAIPVIACKTYSLHGHRVVRVSDLEALGIKVNEIKPANA